MPRGFFRFVLYFCGVLLGVWLFLNVLSVPRELVTETVIRAPIQRVWNSVIELDNYPMWNPFIKHAGGRVAVNSDIEMEIHLPGRQVVHLNSMVEEAKEVAALQWSAGYNVPGVIDLTNRIEMKFQDMGTVKVTQTQRFSGLLIGPLTEGMLRRWEEGSADMLEGLKKHCQRD